MKYSDLTKRIDISNYEEELVYIRNIKAQYNPDRFKYWESLFSGNNKDILDMLYSPHVRFLSYYTHGLIDFENTDYYKLQKMYGRNNDWIINKINKFIKLYKSICDVGYNSLVILLRKPLVANPYNNGFEIFEGHHRIACCIVNGVLNIPCMVVNNER